MIALKESPCGLSLQGDSFALRLIARYITTNESGNFLLASSTSALVSP